MHFQEDFILTLSYVPCLRLLGWMKAQYTTTIFQILLPVKNWDLGGGDCHNLPLHMCDHSCKKIRGSGVGKGEFRAVGNT